MMLILILLLYLISVVISWFFMRLFYLLSGTDSKYYPHYLMLTIVLIPIGNVVFSIGFALIEFVGYSYDKLPVIDYKKIFKIK